MTIAFVNLPAFSPKKPHNQLYFLQRSMNLGLLSVGSAASASGARVGVYDWLGPQHAEVQTLVESIVNLGPSVVGFSLPSGYGEPWLRLLARRLKGHLPNLVIVAGGQYHAGMRALPLLTAVPELDAVCTGAGEQVAWERIADGDFTGLVSRSSLHPPESPPRVPEVSLDFSLSQFDLRGYAPSVEFSRGCPFKCEFCSLSGAPTRLSRVAAEEVDRQLRFWVDLWSDLPRRIPIYVECPIFFANRRNVDAIAAAFNAAANRVEWRVQARSESIEPAVLDALYELGLRTIDLGLESASPTILRRMEKTRDPSKYLRTASDLLEAAARSGISVKLNVLLYPGETMTTLGETWDWITARRGLVAGVSAGSAIEFPGTHLGQMLGEYSQDLGTSRVLDPELAAAGIFPLNLSREISYDAARNWCLSLSRAMMDMDDYFSLKRVGYFPPGLSLADFEDAVKASDPRDLPFSLPQLVQERASRGAVDLPLWDQLR